MNLQNRGRSATKNFLFSQLPLSSDQSPSNQDKRRLNEIHNDNHWLSKLRPFVILIPVSCSFALLGLSLIDYKTSGWLYHVTKSNRSIVQFVVHIIASLLGVFWSYAVCRSIQRWTTQRLVYREVSLNKLRLWVALSTANTNLNLPLDLILWTLIFLALASLPASLWTASLTPQFEMDDSDTMGIAIPKTGLGSYSHMWTGQLDGVNYCWQDLKIYANGTFSNCPFLQRGPQMLVAAGSATTIDGSVRRHQKYDNTHFQYLGRSYGVGASVGLFDLEDDSIRNYSFLEDGYLTRVHCIYNESSQWLLYPPQSAYGMSLISALGYLPNSNWSAVERRPLEKIEYLAPARAHLVQAKVERDRETVVAFGSSLAIGADLQSLPEYYVALAANSHYSQFDKMQCQLIFEPTTFRVNVSLLNSTVEVQPQGPAATDPEPTGRLRWTVQQNFLGLSAYAESIAYPRVGRSLLDNFANKAISNHHGSVRNSYEYLNDFNRTLYLEALTDSVTSIADDALEMLSAATLTDPAMYVKTQAKVEREAIQIGSRNFIIATLVLNIAGLMFVILFGMRGMLSGNVPMFDYTDPASIAIGAASGCVDDDREKTETSLPRHADTWGGDARDKSIRGITARLELTRDDRLGLRLR